MIINIHLNPPSEEQRFDTLISPSGSVARLLKVEEELGVTDTLGIDEAFPGESEARNKIRETVLETIQKGEKPILLFSVLLYNAERTVKYIEELKAEFGDKIRIGVGGQLVREAKKAYLNNPSIDIVCEGDSEIILPKLLRDFEEGRVERAYTGWVKDVPGKKFSGESYDNFYGIQERLEAQKREQGFSRLVVEGPGGPGCAWAANNPKGACEFCALQNITFMSRNKVEDALETERELQDKFHPDKFFDVANLFTPEISHKNITKWLREYIKARDGLGLTAEKYAYMTVSAINKEVAELLKKAGVTEVYLGIDHFNQESLKEQNKPWRSVEGTLKKCLYALKENGIKFRAGIVLGNGKETNETLQSVREGVDWLIENYRENISDVGVFPIELLPGADKWNEAKESGIRPDLFKKFDELGYLSREDQDELTRAWIEKNSEVSPEQIYELRGEVMEDCKKEGIHASTVGKSPELEAPVIETEVKRL